MRPELFGDGRRAFVRLNKRIEPMTMSAMTTHLDSGDIDSGAVALLVTAHPRRSEKI